MVRINDGVLYVVMGVVLATGVWSSGHRVCLASQSSQGLGFTVEGKIDSLSENKLTLSTEENMIFHVRYDERTEIKNEDGSSASSKDLRKGQQVRVEGEFSESGEVAAARIQILKPPAKK